MNKLRSLRRMLSMLLALALALSLVPSVFAAESDSASAPEDELQGHWAEKQLREWVQSGLLKGDNNGAYNPDKAITRAELISLINRAFGFTEKVDIHFTDIDFSNWAYIQVAIAVQAGYTHGYEDNTIRTDQPITREEAAVMIAHAIKLDGDNVSDSLKAFSDAAVISTWGKPYIAALASQQLIHGTPAGNFSPQGQLTRAEAVTLLNQAMKAMNADTAYSEAGDYGPEAGTRTIIGNVVVSAPDVTLRNTVILGNLTLTEGVGEGDANFNNVTVKGTTTIQGGGENSIHFADSILVRVVINKATGTVRVVAIGKSAIGHVVVNSPVKLEESHVTDSGFQNVELASALPAGSEVSLSGMFENVSMFSSDIKVSIPSGSINQLNVDEGAKNTQIEVSTEARVLELILNSVAKVLGQGTIDKATVFSSAKGSTFEKKPLNVEGDAKDSVVVQQPVAGGGGASTGGSGSNSGSDDDGGTSKTCQGTTEQCADAHLLGLSVPGYELVQLDPSTYTTDQIGFNPDILAYQVSTDLDNPSGISVSVTSSVYTTATVLIFNNTRGQTVETGTLTPGPTTNFALMVNPKEDYTVYLNVKSGDGKKTNQYQIRVRYKRGIQEAVKIVSDRFNLVDEGMTVTTATYHLEFGEIEGVSIRHSDTIQVYAPGDPTPVLDYTNNQHKMIPQDKLTLSTTGTLQFKILRDSVAIVEGDYHYDFSQVPALNLDAGISVVTMSKQQLFDAPSHNPNLTFQPHYGYWLYMDKSELLTAFPGAKYYSWGRSSVPNSMTMPPALTNEELKIGMGQSGYSSIFMNTLNKIYDDQPIDRPILTTYFQETGSVVFDEFVRLAFYNDNFELLGQTIVVITFDNAHVADGKTAAQNYVAP